MFQVPPPIVNWGLVQLPWDWYGPNSTVTGPETVVEVAEPAGTEVVVAADAEVEVPEVEVPEVEDADVVEVEGCEEELEPAGGGTV